jgi:hypothetical protein
MGIRTLLKRIEQAEKALQARLSLPKIRSRRKSVSSTSRGNEFLGLRKHLSNRRVVNDPPYRLPEPRITAAGVCVYIREEAMAQAARRSYRW